jgi:F-box domain
MSLPPLFSLSNELILEIISHLPPKDICTFRLACSKLNSLIVNSQLIQYIIRTAQSGVFDTLEPGLSLPERQDALQQWESSWAEMDLRKPGVRIHAPVTSKNGQPVEFSFGRYFVVIREGYGWPAGYSFLDMRATFSPQDDGTGSWTKIEIETPNVLVLAFASELDLSVAIACVYRSLIPFLCGTRSILVRLGHHPPFTAIRRFCKSILWILLRESHTRWHPNLY